MAAAGGARAMRVQAIAGIGEEARSGGSSRCCGSKNGSSRDLTLAKDQPQAPTTPPKPLASIKGGVAVFRAKDGDWDAHVAMVRQAPRLCLLAQAKGANAAVFLWPSRGDGHPPTQPLLPSPNFDVARDTRVRAPGDGTWRRRRRASRWTSWEFLRRRTGFARYLRRSGSMRRRARLRVLDQASAGGRGGAA